MKKPIEEKVADVILERPKIVTIGKRKYKVDRLTNRMLIRVSALIAKHIPEMNGDTTNVLAEVLRAAKDCEGIGEICSAAMVRPGIFYSLRRKIVANAVLDSDPSDTQQLIISLFSTKSIGDFFGLIIFLSEVNHLKPTTGEMIASGQLSEDSVQHLNYP